mmetsp:Transcript_10327/g.23356  ORF Transcript_10327/g.23356 Transcript_10327/m.23356 type:complete len:254 (+) Transcript_10327:318-1079(+)
MERYSFSRRVSSTPTVSWTLPPSASRSLQFPFRPPGCTIVKFVFPLVPLQSSMRYRSAARFHFRILPSPIAFRRLSSCVPPMELHTTTSFTPLSTAASNCAFCPSQSTSSGVPFSGQRNVGIAGFMLTPGMKLRTLVTSSLTMDLFMILGVADVQQMSASNFPSLMTSLTDVPSTMEATTTSSSLASGAKLATIFFDFSVRTTPTTRSSSASCTHFANTAFPVFPPAPVMMTDEIVGSVCARVFTIGLLADDR